MGKAINIWVLRVPIRVPARAACRLRSWGSSAAARWAQRVSSSPPRDSRALFPATFCHLIFNLVRLYCGTNGGEWGGLPNRWLLPEIPWAERIACPKEQAPGRSEPTQSTSGETKIPQEIHEGDHGLLGFQVGSCVKAPLHFQGENQSQS